MAISSIGSGTQTATVDTEHVLDTETDPGVYMLVVDTANMVNGDYLTLKIKVKCLSGGTSRIAFQATYAHIQAEPIKYSPPVPADIELVVTLEQDAGTSRDFPWSLLKVG